MLTGLKMRAACASMWSSKHTSRGDAINAAKAEKEAYVVWLQLRSDNLGRSGSTGDVRDIVIEFTIFDPTTAKVKTQGTSYPGAARSGGTVISPGSAGNRNEAIAESRLREAARDAAERILKRCMSLRRQISPLTDENRQSKTRPLFKLKEFNATQRRSIITCQHPGQVDWRSGGEVTDHLPNRALRCHACGHRCLINDGKRGICKVRFNEGGHLRVPMNYVAALACDPTEKKPFFHVLPGSDTLTFGMLGCDLHCAYCQNWLTSQALRDDAAGTTPRSMTPDRLVAMAKAREPRW